MPNYPTVNLLAVDGFLKVYNRGGLHLLFDGPARQAMVDFANIALKSYVDDLTAKARAALRAKQAPAPAVAPPVASPSGITLTDA